MFIEKELSSFSNIFDVIGKDWMLITAGDGEKVNTMTASWGCAGILWGKPVCVCFIRPQRYTYEFAEASDRISMSFFGRTHREALKICGTKSGRDCDKIREAGLSVGYCGATPYIAEANAVLICRKLYADDLREDKFILPEIVAEHYNGDFHRFYVCEIEKLLVKE